MQTADHAPNDETKRLEVLRQYSVLDTPAEDAFDRIVQLACSLFATPMAAISLIDAKRQWFKASVGLDVQETPREIALCAHAIQRPEVMVVTDARHDPRFATNPLVSGAPFVRFYAGAPVRTPDGHALGAICVISPEPRAALSTEDQQRLAVLAGIVANELELRRQLRRISGLAEENRLLLRQIHHQIGNSLQLVSDVLQFQLQRAVEPQVRSALQSAIGRVNTIGSVHRQLYLGQHDGKADAAVYLPRLLHLLWRSLLPDDSTRRLAIHVEASLLSADCLSRVGLAATELVTNALQHGQGDVSVTLQPVETGVRLMVGDQGPGFSPMHRRVPRDSRLGLMLVRLLAVEDGLRVDPVDGRTVIVDLPG